VPLLEISSVASDPPMAIAVMVNVIKWFMIGAGLLCAVCFILLKKEKPIERSHTVLHEAPERIAKTDWVMIARLVGLSVLFSLINAVMETGLFPFMGGIEAKRYTPHTMTVIAAICLCAFLAGRYSINRFLQWFLPPAIMLFIFLPCLVLFDGYPGFILLISTLVSIFRFSLWIIFTVAIVECYAPYGKGFWFFGLTSLVHYTGALSFLGPAINRAVPSGIEFTVLLMCISAVLFVFLSLRIIFPKTLPVTAAEAQPSAAKMPSITSFKNFEDTFREHKLSRREIEVAALLIQEGLGANEIGNRLFISERTVNDHIASIYRKFAVRKRGEFMAMFVGK
jgi:DNA-binding CsgD family transcriptional regulator